MSRGKEFLERIKNGEVLIADGAMGTLLMEYGLKPGEPPESFNLDNEDILEWIAKSYLDAGAEIIQTNTFGGSPIKLSLYSLEKKVEEINRNAVHAVRRVVEKDAYVSGSCGPSGKLLKPYGEVEEDEMYHNYETQTHALIDAGVDILCVETMTDLTEATIAIRAARGLSTTIPIMATMTFDPSPRGFYTVMGNDIERAVKGLVEAGADIIGSNCGNGIENMIKIAREFKMYCTTPLIIQSNAGIPVIRDGKTIYPESPEFMAEKSKELADIGVSIIGGCCGTTPDHIRKIREAVKGT
jgi:5-methyltetrahydrofolate--homocysteine methyltransferase